MHWIRNNMVWRHFFMICSPYLHSDSCKAITTVSFVAQNRQADDASRQFGTDMDRSFVYKNL